MKRTKLFRQPSGSDKVLTTITLRGNHKAAKGGIRSDRQTAAAFRGSIPPGVNSGAIDLQFLRSTPLIETNIDREGIDRAFDEDGEVVWS